MLACLPPCFDFWSRDDSAKISPDTCPWQQSYNQYVFEDFVESFDLWFTFKSQYCVSQVVVKIKFAFLRDANCHLPRIFQMNSNTYLVTIFIPFHFDFSKQHSQMILPRKLHLSYRFWGVPLAKQQHQQPFCTMSELSTGWWMNAQKLWDACWRRHVCVCV